MKPNFNLASEFQSSGLLATAGNYIYASDVTQCWWENLSTYWMHFSCQKR